MDGEEAAHEGVKAAVIGVAAGFEAGKCITGVRP